MKPPKDPAGFQKYNLDHPANKSPTFFKTVSKDKKLKLKSPSNPE